jgi:hypothetical protein
VASLAGIAGLTGMARHTGLTQPDLAALSKLAVNGGKSDGDHPGKDEGNKDKNGKRHNGKGHNGEVRHVPCDPAELIGAITRANAEDGATLELAHDCTYTLTANQAGNGLPIIVRPINIKGNDATIVRAANAVAFRIFNVGVGGDLTLHDVTVKGGQDNTLEGGGGILVQARGTAKVVHSTITLNTTAGDGGGIVNYGTTTVVDSTLTDNSATVEGGALGDIRGLLTVEETKILRNNAEIGGGIHTGGGTVVINKTAIRNNNVGPFGFGGGIAADGDVTVKHSNISDNTSPRGGGIARFNGFVAVEHSTVSRNTAHSGSGGGIFNAVGGGDLVIEGSAITGNTAAGNGGGLHNLGVADLRNSQVSQNNAIDPNSRGGGIFNAAILALTDTRVTENSSTMQPGGVFTNNNQVTVDNESVIIKNRPTNCTGSPEPVPNCFG